MKTTMNVGRRLTASFQLFKNNSLSLSSTRLFSSNSDGMKSTWKRLPSRGWSPGVNSNTKPKNKPPSGPFVNFGKQFVIPTLEPQENILAATNGYPLDSRITCTLVDKKEQFVVDGNVTDMSISEIVEEFFEKFNADNIIHKMMNGNKWPREGYTNPDGSPYTEAEIKRKWNSISDYAKNRDIWMHHNIARYFNQLELLPSQDKNMDRQFLSFHEEVIKGNQMQPHRTSWPIVAPDEGVAGMVDFMGRFPDGTMALFLWKRSKTLADNLHSQFNRKGQFPIEHLDDCEGSKCYLQLNFLKYILEKYYNVTVRFFYKRRYTQFFIYEQNILLHVLFFGHTSSIHTYIHTYILYSFDVDIRLISMEYPLFLV